MADMDNNGFFNGNGFVVLLLFMLMMGGNWFGFGGCGNNNFGMRDYSARAEIAEGFNTSEIKQGIGGLAHGQYDLNTSILNNRYENAVGMAGLDRGIMQSRYDTLLGQNAISAQIAQNRYDAAIAAQVAQAQMASCCCDIKTQLHSEGEATRAMLQQQTIDDLKSQLNQAQTAVANAIQTQNITQNILGQMGRWVANAPMPVVYNGYGNAYANGCGCGAYANGCGCA